MEIEQTYIELKPELISLAYRFLGSVVEAEDIVHEAFISLNAAIKGHNKEQIRNLKAYLICVKLCLIAVLIY